MCKMNRLFKSKVENESTKLLSKIQEIVRESGAKIIEHNSSSWLNNDDAGFTIKLIIKKERKR